MACTPAGSGELVALLASGRPAEHAEIVAATMERRMRFTGGPWVVLKGS
jgi:hypothetical protein